MGARGVYHLGYVIRSTDKEPPARSRWIRIRRRAISAATCVAHSQRSTGGCFAGQATKQRPRGQRLPMTAQRTRCTRTGPAPRPHGRRMQPPTSCGKGVVDVTGGRRVTRRRSHGGRGAASASRRPGRMLLRRHGLGPAPRAAVQELALAPPSDRPWRAAAPTARLYEPAR
jgi:hypothetical protein